ncbi:MAG: hypothetical protein WBQ30_08940 [Thermoanaerobaculia bacterium]|jgi:hypothetical protein
MSTKALRAPSWLGLVAVAVAGARAECHQQRLLEEAVTSGSAAKADGRGIPPH